MRYKLDVIWLCWTVQTNLMESSKKKFSIGICDIRVLVADIKKEWLSQYHDELVGCRKLSIH